MLDGADSDVLMVADTSVAIPLLIASHQAHDAISAWAVGRSLGLSGHALAETMGGRSGDQLGLLFTTEPALAGRSSHGPTGTFRLADERCYALAVAGQARGGALRRPFRFDSRAQGDGNGEVLER